MSIKKKTIKIIVGIIVAIAVIVGGIFAFQFISTNMKIKDTEEKLSQINAEELQSKLIKELESTSLNVQVNNGNQFVITEFVDNGKGYISASICLVRGKNIDVVGIPCFHIERDNNGKFKNITYLENGFEIENIVGNAVRKVFKNEYDVNIIEENDSGYNSHFRQITQMQEITYTDTAFWETIYQKITGDIPYNNSIRLNTIKFAI